ncbi:hypothetical protein HDZ31DRAFT_80909 [Schizophyllum fasciatum]
MADQELPSFRSRTPEFVQPPHPEWKYGESVSATEEGRKWLEGVDDPDAIKEVDPLATPPRDLYNLVKSGVVPRPIAFVSTTSADGVDNLAPFSFFNVFTIGVAFSISEGERTKDTLANIRSENGFVVNLISEPWIMNAHAAAIPAPAGVSEWGFSGLTKAPSKIVKAPRVKESAFAMECQFLHQYEVRHPHNGQLLYTHVLGEVKYIHVRRSVLDDRGNIDIRKYKPVARMGDISYATVGDVYRIPAPSWEHVEHQIPDEHFSMPADIPSYPWRAPELVKVPDPEWTYGKPVAATEKGREWMEGADDADSAFKGIDPADIAHKDLYNLMKSGIVPRPIAFVSTTSADRIDNIAPFSSLNFVTGIISFFIQEGEHGTTDTLSNIRTGNGFVVNIISEPWIANAHAAALSAPPGVSEWPFSGLTKMASHIVKPPRVKESAFAMECELLHQHDIREPLSGKLQYTHVMGRVVYIHVRRDVLDERGTVDIRKLKPIARVGGMLYSTVGTVFPLSAPSWASAMPLIPEDLRQDEREVQEAT